ncbi:MAG TPA: HAD-IIIA family hydrolase [Deltaproteobacteria bacterium]|nr:HAD-IIIA family hydrolase [Deltaproteobacteria bacterium]
MKPIKVFVLDVDGVLTDGKIYFNDRGEEMKAFDSKDGHGIKLIMRAGLKVAIITGRTSKALEHRAGELGITHLIQGAKDKRAALLELAGRIGCDPGEMAYMGDDVVDMPAMVLCGLSFAPADAVEMVKSQADHVTERGGGRGAVREAIEILLKHLGMYDQIMERYRV